MKIYLEHISKKIQKHWIFKDINFTFEPPTAYALLGANGSGKSTLLRILAGIQTATYGKISFLTLEGSQIEKNEIYKQISFCAPSQELVEELTLQEFFEFHFSFKRPLPSLTIDNILNLTGLKAAINQPIGDYSSGMKQRVKLAQAIFSNTPILLLDEPCTNLDQQGVDQYREWINQYTSNRLVIIASNDVREYSFCTKRLEVEQYK